MTPLISCLSDNVDEVERFERPLVFGSAIAPSAIGRLGGVVLPHQPASRAEVLLERGAARVFVGEAALADRGLVARLATRYGGERVGVYVAASRMANQWSFETTSNADFKVVTPSCCEPAWDVLRADGSGTGLSVQRWVAAMVEAGARSALVQVDIEDDTDLNLCAGLVETLGEHVCLTPARQKEPVLDDWVRYGQARWIALAPPLYLRRRALMVPRSAQEMA
jgi:hypothetical protein